KSRLTGNGGAGHAWSARPWYWRANPGPPTERSLRGGTPRALGLDPRRHIARHGHRADRRAGVVLDQRERHFHIALAAIPLHTSRQGRAAFELRAAAG